MIVAVSTSSPLTSLALIEGEAVLWAGEEHAPMRSGEALESLLDRMIADTGRPLSDAEAFYADQGPGSFTGVRVGIVWAKTMAWLNQVPCGGATAFDLISPSQTVSFPSRKGEFYIRVPGQPVDRASTPPEGAIGFGFDGHEAFPRASGFAGLVVAPVSALEFMPEYGMEPSISVAKKPLAGPLGRLEGKS